jgi:hypothetical protein
LKRILDHAERKPITLQKIIEILHGRGLDLLVLLLALPFCIPIPLLGLSTPFGLALMFLGSRISFRKDPWLPQRLLQREIPYETLTRIIQGAVTVTTRLEKVLHPRLRFFKQWATFTALNGLVIASCAFILMLPIPFPFTNTLPALSIVLTAAGMIEEDGAVIIAGYLMAVAAWAYLLSLWLLGKMGVNLLGL